MLKKSFIMFILIAIMSVATVYAVDMYGAYPVPVDIDVNGNFIKCTEKPIMIDGTTYIPIRALSDAIGGEIIWDEGTKTATLTKDGHQMVFYSDKNHSIIDGVEKDYSSVNYKDLIFVPVRVISETLGYGVEWDDYYLAVKITAPDVLVPETALDNTYTYEDILYLAKITMIESGTQSLEMKIGISNTILNRVKSSQFPNTIKGVIFDTKYGVQFPPAHTDIINKTPSRDCVVAAKNALNGVELVGNSLYFISTKAAPSSWAHKNRPYYTTIGNTNFYE